MPLQDKISADLKEAMKSKDAGRVSAIRMLLADLKNKRISLMRDLTDDDVIGVITTAVKQRRDSAEQFKNAGRADLEAKETAEIAILQGYMPEQMSEADVSAAVDSAIAETGAKSAADMGKVMKAVMPKVKGRADGGLVNKLVKQKLGG